MTAEQVPMKLNGGSDKVLSVTTSAGSAAKEDKLKKSGDPHGGGDRDPGLPPAPDGGWGWAVVFGSFMVHVIADGMAYSFGIYVDEFVDYFECSHSEVGALGSLMLGVTWGTGPIASVLVNKFGCRTVTVLGTLIAAAGFIISIFAPNIWFMFFSFGIVAGFGLGLAYLPAIVAVSFYFEKRRSLATGIAVCGSGVGTFIFAPLTRALLDEFTWKGTVLIESAMLLNCILCGMVFRPLEMQPAATKPPTSVTDADVKFVSVTEVPVTIKYDDSSKVTSSCNAIPQLSKVSIEEGRRRTQSESWMVHNAKTAKSVSVSPDVLKLSTRKDVFYTKSLDNIPMYKNDPDQYHKSIASMAADDPDKGKSCLEKFGFSKDAIRTFKQLMDFRLLLDVIFQLFAISNFLTSIGFVVPYIFLPDRGKENGLEKHEASWLISMVGISNTIGRIVFGYIADFKFVNRLMMYNTVLVVCGVVSVFSFVCTNYASMMVYSFCFGLLIGVYTCLTPIVLVDLLGLEKLSNAFGLVLLYQGIGAVVGPPIAGAIFDSTKNYDNSFIMMGMCLLVSGLMLYPIPCIKRFQHKKDSETDIALGKLPDGSKPAEEEAALNV